MAEWSDRLLSCLADAGIGVTAQSDGGYLLDPRGLSDSAFDALNSQCADQVGPQPTPSPVTAEEASALYDLNLEAMECLARLGVSVEPPPSREKYIEQYIQSHLAMVAPWSPFKTVGDTYLDQCPQPRLEDLPPPGN